MRKWMQHFPVMPMLFYVCACAVSTCILLLFYSDLDITLTPLYMCEFVLMDVLILLCAYWISPKRMGVPVVCGVWLLSLFLGANSLYYAYWGSLISVNTIFSLSSYNAFVGNAVIKLITFKSTLYIVLPAILTAIYIFIRRCGAKDFVSSWMKVSIISISVILFVAASFMRTRRYAIYLSDIGMGDDVYALALKHRYSSFGKPSGLDALSYQGVAVYSLSQFIAAIRPRYIRLTPEERDSVEKFLSESPVSDAMLDCNRDKNLIFIIVESLNADYIGREYNGVDITPVLSSLVDKEGSVSSLNMVVQIHEGGSSDGQMIYNTGLLPLKTGVASFMYGDNTFPSLAKMFPDRMSVEIIPEHKKVWNHGVTSVSYGYKRLFDAQDLEEAGYDTDIRGADGALFDFAMTVIDSISQPFVCTIPTISMHYPFSNPGVPDYGFKDILNETEHAYLNSLRYFDIELGKFLTKLDSAGVLENSVVVIASDHDMCTDDPQKWGRGLRLHPAAFIAINTGITKQIAQITSQMDLFPTVMDIMGVTGNSWRGVGVSMLSRQHPGGALDSNGKLHGNADPRYQKAADVSDLIIRSNYFNAGQ